MVRLYALGCLLLLLLLLPGCAAVKIATVVSKTGATAGKVGVGASKAATVGKVATVGVATGAAGDLAIAASGLDDVWRLGATAGRSVNNGDDLRFLSEGARVGDKPGRSALSTTLDGALLGADFASWAQDCQPEPDRRAGEGAPEDVRAALLAATRPDQALTKTKLVDDRYWMQFFRTKQGDRLVVYDTAKKTTQVLRPAP